MAQCWYFSYGSNIDESRLKKSGIKVFDSKVATLKGFNIGFNKKNADNSLIMDSDITESPYGVTEGIAYLIDENDLKKLDKLENHPKNSQKRILEIKFRGDKDDQPVKEAVVYSKIQERFDRQSYKHGNPASGGMMKLKSTNRNFKIESMRPGGGMGNTNNYTVAFESEIYEENDIINDMKYLLSYEEFINEKHDIKSNDNSDTKYHVKHLINRTPIMERPTKGRYTSKREIRKSKILLHTAKEHIDKIN